MSVMDLLTRLRRLIASNVNALVESFGDPGAAIDELIGNMEDAAREARQQVLQALTEDKLTEKRRAATEKSMIEWESRAARAVAAGDDHLAKEALMRAAELKEEIASIVADRGNAKEQITQLEAGLRDLEAKIGAVKARKETLKNVVRTRAKAGKDNGAAARYDQIVAGVDAAEAENELSAELDEAAKTANVSQRIDRLEKNQDADARLAALKEKMKK